MIAIPRFQLPDGLAADVRRRVGGRALQVSEYAARLVAAIDELTEHVYGHDYPDGTPLSLDDVERLIELDGRVEALRMRLGIECIRTPDKEKFDVYTDREGFTISTEWIGFSRICLVHRSNWRPSSKRQTQADPSIHWSTWMRSLRAIAAELATAPELDPEETDIVGLIVEMKRRLTKPQILAEFDKRGIIKSESTVRQKLSQLTKRKVLVNRSDTDPIGYGLPEWSY